VSSKLIALLVRYLPHFLEVTFVAHQNLAHTRICKSIKVIVKGCLCKAQMNYLSISCIHCLTLSNESLSVTSYTIIIPWAPIY
jgi:hypothetical protein